MGRETHRAGAGGPKGQGAKVQGSGPRGQWCPLGTSCHFLAAPELGGDPGSGHGTRFSWRDLAPLSRAPRSASLRALLPPSAEQTLANWGRRERLPARRHSPSSSVGIQSILGNLLPHKIPTRKQRSSAILSRALKQSLCGTWLLFGFAIH